MKNFNFAPYHRPILFAMVLAIGIFIGSKLGGFSKRSPDKPVVSSVRRLDKINAVLDYIENEYVDSIDRNKLIDKSLESLVSSLDPHSAYIPASELAEVNEPLEGNFEGIGVEFNIQKDTIIVINPIAGGPSEVLGIKPGDRIVKIDSLNVASIKITSADVVKKLRGKMGTKVKVSIFRNHKTALVDYTITRGKIPLNSVDIAYMLTEKTGYIKISRFASTTYDEFAKGFKKLDHKNMNSLVLDLRGNGGGFLATAVKICEELLDKDKLIVYTKGRAKPKAEYRVTKNGFYRKGNLFILVDESSASASEIVAGAIQDNDRGTIIGRRTFGKGLVQEQMEFKDNSAMRLTIARYYTPTGRCIQKPYKNGSEEYYMEYYKRFQNGEIENKDSIHFNDSLKYKTPKGKVVYGGGGIMPDIFVPMDTVGVSGYYSHLMQKGLIRQFAFDYSDQNREKLKGLGSFDEFDKVFTIDANLFAKFVKYAEKEGVKGTPKNINRSAELIKTQLKALIARNSYGNDGFYPIINRIDKTILETLKRIK